MSSLKNFGLKVPDEEEKKKEPETPTSPPADAPAPSPQPMPAKKVMVGNFEVVEGEYFLSHDRLRCGECGQEFIIDPDYPQDADTTVKDHFENWHPGVLPNYKEVKYVPRKAKHQGVLQKDKPQPVDESRDLL